MSLHDDDFDAKTVLGRSGRSCGVRASQADHDAAVPEGGARVVRASGAIAAVGLAGSEHERPSEPSGGMRRRVGIARAPTTEPKILRMDEPSSALDALTRGTPQDEVRRICIATGRTLSMITHDVDEAIHLADRIVPMTDGPTARVAEIVANPLGRDRDRTALHHAPHHCALRDHLIGSLVSRSKAVRDAPPPGGTDGAAA